MQLSIQHGKEKHSNQAKSKVHFHPHLSFPLSVKRTNRKLILSAQLRTPRPRSNEDPGSVSLSVMTARWKFLPVPCSFIFQGKVRVRYIINNVNMVV